MPRDSGTQTGVRQAASGGRDGTSAVQLAGLTMQFDSGVVALDDVSVELPQGKFIAVVGPSGCGKSTLLRHLAGLLPPTAGNVKVFGEELTAPRSEIGMMFQKPTLLDWRTSLENVLLPHELGARKGGRKVANTRRGEAVGLLQMLGLEGFEHAYPPHLSGGMQQRVALARLLLTHAEMMLLDEPFGALDEFTRERLDIELTGIFENLHPTIILVTHNINEAVLLADQILVMTPSPGRLAGVVDIDLPRPRAIEVMRTPEFTQHSFEVRELLGSHIA